MIAKGVGNVLVVATGQVCCVGVLRQDVAMYFSCISALRAQSAMHTDVFLCVSVSV